MNKYDGRWKKHIDYINKKMCKSIGILYKVKSAFSKRLMFKMFKAFVLPRIIYCNVVWGSAQPTVLKPLIISQKRSLNVALQLPKCTPSAILLSLAKVLTIMYKYLHKMLPDSFSSMYVYNNENHQLGTRCAP